MARTRRGRPRSTTPNPEIPTEAQEQRALVRWIRFQPEIIEDIIKLNNEGKRTEAQGFNLKMLGMCVGASDLFLAYPAHGKCGLWIEMKKNKKYTKCDRETSTWIAQEKFIERRRARGYAAHMVFGWEHGKNVIEAYLEGRDELL